jgi:hypothetical protein
MLCTRVVASNTGENARYLVDYIKHSDTNKVTLYASPTSGSEGATNEDGPDTNFPLVAALVEFNLPHGEQIQIVMDGLFLTAQRHPRYSEVKSVLDEAEHSSTVFFAKNRAPFTASLAPGDAASKLASVSDVQPFDSSTRAEYFRLLSSLSEGDFT